ncbi:MAG: NADP-dependent oxidoreductase [Steroidobacteraceae bacterium]
MATMKAARIHDYGGPEVFHYDDIPRPEPKDDELLVRVHAVGVNPADWKIRSGFTRSMFTLPMPAIVGGDIAGVVEQVGANASGFKVGDEVFAMLGLVGAYAQYVTVKPALVALKPKSLDFTQAASVPLAALTAWQALVDNAQVQAGQKVLIHAASGGVGSFAVQIAKSKGAVVTGTTSAGNAAYVREIGASDVIDYRSEKFESRAKDMDVVIDLLGGETGEKSISVLKPGGILVQISGTSEAVQKLAEAAKVRAVKIMVKPNGEQLREIAKLIDAGKIRTTIAHVFPLSEAGKAQEQSKTGHTRGKIVMTAV